MADTTPPTERRREPRLTDAAASAVLVVLGDDGDDRPGFMLGDARLSLGAGAEDDVYLTGVGVVPGHLRLIFLEGRMTLLSSVEEVRVDGETVTAFPFDLKPLQVLSLGPDTHLAYGEPGSAWPPAAAWTMPEAEPEALQAPADEAGTDTHDAVDARVPMTRRARVVHGARLLALALTAATVIVVGLVVTDLAWSSGENVVPGEVAIERSEDVLRKMIAADRENFASVSLTEREDGALSLTGFLDSEEAYSRLAEQVRQQLVASGGNVRMDVLTTARMELLMRDILSRFPLGGRLDVSPSRVLLTVYGVKLKPDVMDRVRSDLARLGPRIKPRKLDIEFNVHESEKLVRDVSVALSRSAATRDLRFEIDETGGHILGVVPAALEREAAAAALAILKTFETQVPLTVDLKVDAKLNFSVVTLTQGGELPTATLSQRGKVQTFRVGEAVFGVGELVDIRADGVMLALGKREVFIPMTR